MSALVVGDVHLSPKLSHSRQLRLLRFAIQALQPTHIILMGDVGDYESLLGKIPKLDKSSYIDEYRQHVSFLRSVQRAAPAAKLVHLEGNHEYRIRTWRSANPEMAEAISCWDSVEGWEVVPLDAEPGFILEGWLFCHYYRQKDGRPVSAANLSDTLLRYHASMVVGHDHRFQISSDTTAFGQKIHAISAGCFVHPEYGDYAAKSRERWDSGLLWISDLRSGMFGSIQWLTADYLDRQLRSRKGN